MKSTKITTNIQKGLERLLKQFPLVNTIATAIDNQKGRALLVGGAVRDLLLDLPVKDLDIEVHGFTLDQLTQVLESFGPVSLVGKAFGVLFSWTRHSKSTQREVR